MPVVKNPPANTGDTREEGLIPGLGRSPGGGQGNPLQGSCLENAMDRGAWRAAVHGVTKSRTWLKYLGQTHKSCDLMNVWNFTLLLTLLLKVVPKRPLTVVISIYKVWVVSFSFLTWVACALHFFPLDQSCTVLSFSLTFPREKLLALLIFSIVWVFSI